MRMLARVDHPAVVPGGATPGGDGGIVSLDQRLGARHLVGRRSECGRNDRQLAWMDTLLAVEADRPRDAAGALEAGGVLVGGEWTIQALQSVGPRRGDDRVHHRVVAMAWIGIVAGIQLADRRRRHLHRRRVITLAEDQRGQPG